MAARPRFGARWARPTTTDPAAVAAGSFARLGRSSSRRAPCASAERQQQQQQQQTPVARTSMQPRSAPLGSASSRRGRSRARSVASVPIARVVSLSSSSSSAGRRRQQQQHQQREAVGAVGDDVASVSAAGLGKQQMARQPSVLDAQSSDRFRASSCCTVLYCTSLALYRGAAREQQRLAAALNECPPSMFVTPLLAACRACSGGFFCVPIVLTIILSRHDALQSWASQQLADMSSPQAASAPSRLRPVGRW